jgi:hypothetical protein
MLEHFLRKGKEKEKKKVEEMNRQASIPASSNFNSNMLLQSVSPVTDLFPAKIDGEAIEGSTT